MPIFGEGKSTILKKKERKKKKGLPTERNSKRRKGRGGSGKGAKAGGKKRGLIWTRQPKGEGRGVSKKVKKNKSLEEAVSRKTTIKEKRMVAVTQEGKKGGTRSQRSASKREKKEHENEETPYSMGDTGLDYIGRTRFVRRRGRKVGGGCRRERGGGERRPMRTAGKSFNSKKETCEAKK